MKIPETSANVGAYYGNEEGQWQANGVILDSGVGGGVVGSGDAGVHRPPVYPVQHMPRAHIPGYVMAGPYYPPAYPAVPPPQDDFADYMWMENEEEFDKQVMQQLEEEALMEQCIEAMLEDEQRERHRPVANGHNQYPTTSNGSSSLSLEETVSRSTLNPLAAEFVPTRARVAPPEEKTESVTEPSTEVESAREESKPTETEPHHTEESKTEEPIPPPSEPPEVSAADIQPIDKDKKKEKKDKLKPETKKPVRVEPKPKPVVKETKSKQDEEIVTVDNVKQSSPPPADEAPGIKPINYAAAAKAKAKKPTTPPIEKPAIKTDKIEKKVKTEKPIQRKNSAK